MTDAPVVAVVSVVVVTHAAREDVLACLASVEVAARRLGEPVEVVLVDNASTDGTSEAVARRFPQARVVRLAENAGFAGGVDVGLRAARAPWRLTLNDDATLEPDALVELLRVARGVPGDVGALAAQLRFASRPREINSAGIAVDRLGVAVDRHLGGDVGAEPSEPVEVFGASAGAALLRATMLDAVGGFDPSFFLYLEDVDLAWRARQRGWRTLYVPTAVVLHRHSGSSGHGSPLKHYWVGRNRVRVLARNMPRSRLAAAAPAIVAYELAYVAFAVVAGRTLAPVRGRLDGLRDWRSTRRSWVRADVPLGPTAGLRGALRRRGVWPS